jgi:hypothetical protein
MVKYDIVTVDWNKKQTALWRKHIERTCRGYNLIIIPEKRRFPSCWSSPKLYCLIQKFRTPRVIYMDTDTIVTRDLGELFKKMGDAELGLSMYLGKQSRLEGQAGGKAGVADIAKSFGIQGEVTHAPTGLMVFNGMDLQRVYDEWCTAFAVIEKGWPHLPRAAGNKNWEGWSNEVPFSFWLTSRYAGRWGAVWDIGPEYHWYLLGDDKRLRQTQPTPMIIHYHSRPERLGQAGLGWAL